MKRRNTTGLRRIEIDWEWISKYLKARSKEASLNRSNKKKERSYQVSQEAYAWKVKADFAHKLREAIERLQHDKEN
jgi:hypothetical protein